MQTTAKIEVDRSQSGHHEISQHAQGEAADFLHRAQLSNERDQALTIRQAVKKYRKACLWALGLSTALVMEG
jgi:hypothetical protein